MKTIESLAANEKGAGKLSDRKILRATARHNLPVRNLPVKEFITTKDGAAFGRDPIRKSHGSNTEATRIQDEAGDKKEQPRMARITRIRDEPQRTRRNAENAPFSASLGALCGYSLKKNRENDQISARNCRPVHTNNRKGRDFDP
jgi:hypothetical protein